jgi:hypothetical protein
MEPARMYRLARRSQVPRGLAIGLLTVGRACSDRGEPHHSAPAGRVVLEGRADLRGGRWGRSVNY